MFRLSQGLRNHIVRLSRPIRNMQTESHSGGYPAKLDLPAVQAETYASKFGETHFKKHQIEEVAHAAKTTNTWRLVSYFVAIPAVTLCTYAVMNTEDHHEDPRSIPRYSYLGLRIRGPFPWGDESLFWNDHTNYHPEINTTEEKLPLITAFFIANMRKDSDLAEQRRERVYRSAEFAQKWHTLRENSAFPQNQVYKRPDAKFPNGVLGAIA